MMRVPLKTENQTVSQGLDALLLLALGPAEPASALPLHLPPLQQLHQTRLTIAAQAQAQQRPSAECPQAALETEMG